MQTAASCYVKSGRLCIVGVCETADGPVPFSHVSTVSDTPDGPVNFGAELSEPLKVALTESRNDITDQIVRGNIKLVMGNTIDRARAGDQNAMSLLIEVRRKARKNPRARYAFKCFREYVSKHPSGKVDFGEDTKLPPPVSLEELVTRATCTPILSLAVTLADSPYSVQECIRIAKTCQGKKAVRRFMTALKEAHALRQARAGNFGAWASDVAVEF